MLEEKVSSIIQVLSTVRFFLEDEKQLQRQIKDQLVISFPTSHIVSEYTLDSKNVIDFLVFNTVGIEVKIKGSKKEIYKQCVRYLAFDSIQEILLITNKSMGFPPEINGKSCYVLNLGKAWL